MQGTITVNAAASLIPLPNSPLVIPAYGPIVSPVLSSDPALAMPVAVGSIAAGGTTVTIQLQTDQFAGPIDVYFAVTAPAVDPINIYIVTPAGLQTLASVGLVPFMTNILSINAAPFGVLPVASLPPGTYNLLFAITPFGSLSAYDFWSTSFTVM
ncbi:MAG: hypothetical protein HZA17_09535, partial [Nitrospirae bacterium]|nr:hypothetical protein [Nitrospirota bacterium]